jgi:hypothetical protein
VLSELTSPGEKRFCRFWVPVNAAGSERKSRLG